MILVALPDWAAAFLVAQALLTAAGAVYLKRVPDDHRFTPAETLLTFVAIWPFYALLVLFELSRRLRRGPRG